MRVLVVKYALFIGISRKVAIDQNRIRVHCLYIII